MVKRWENIIRKEKTYDVLSIQWENGNEWYRKYSEKAKSPRTQKEKKEKHVWLSGRIISVDAQSVERDDQTYIIYTNQRQYRVRCDADGGQAKADT